MYHSNLVSLYFWKIQSIMNTSNQGKPLDFMTISPIWWSALEDFDVDWCSGKWVCDQELLFQRQLFMHAISMTTYFSIEIHLCIFLSYLKTIPWFSDWSGCAAELTFICIGTEERK